MPEDLVWKFAIQSILALHYIHSKKIIHRDMKSLNLFLDDKENIKVRRQQQNKTIVPQANSLWFAR